MSITNTDQWRYVDTIAKEIFNEVFVSDSAFIFITTFANGYYDQLINLSFDEVMNILPQLLTGIDLIQLIKSSNEYYTARARLDQSERTIMNTIVDNCRKAIILFLIKIGYYRSLDYVKKGNRFIVTVWDIISALGSTYIQVASSYSVVAGQRSIDCDIIVNGQIFPHNLTLEFIKGLYLTLEENVCYVNLFSQKVSREEIVNRDYYNQAILLEAPIYHYVITFNNIAYLAEDVDMIQGIETASSWFNVNYKSLLGDCFSITEDKQLVPIKF